MTACGGCPTSPTTATRIFRSSTETMPGNRSWLNKRVHFRVFAFNEQGTGPGTDASGTSSSSNVPERPTNLMATNRTDATTLEDFGLVDDQDETALGFDVDGDGEAENEAVGADIGFVSRTMIMLEWEAPDDPPGAPVIGYRIDYSRYGNRWFLLAETDEATSSYYDTGLRANAERQYRIYAINTVGRSTVSDGANGNTAASIAPVASSAPVIGLSPAATDVHLTWMPPADPAGRSGYPLPHSGQNGRERDCRR